MGLVWLAGLLILWWILRGISLQELFGVLDNLRAYQLFILVALNAGIFALFALRWWLILKVLGYRLPFRRVLTYRLTAFGITYFTPGPQFGGEPYQIWVVHRRHGVPLPAALSAISLDKMLELMANFSFLMIGLVALMWQGLLPGSRGACLLVLAGLAVTLLGAYLGALSAGRQPVYWLFDRLQRQFATGGWLGRLRPTVQAAEEALMLFCRSRPRALAGLAVLAVGAWIALGAEYWLALEFLGAGLGLAEVIMLMTAARLAFLLPMPAGLGALEAGQVLVVSALGGVPAIGLGMSLLIRARDVVFGLAGLALSVLPQHEPTLSESVEW